MRSYLSRVKWQVYIIRIKSSFSRLDALFRSVYKNARNEMMKERRGAQFYYSGARNRGQAHRRGWLGHPRTWRCATGPSRPFLILPKRCERVELAMSREMTGAEMVIEALADQGVEHHLRLSGRRGAADLRRDLPAGQGPAHPGAPRAGRGACRRRLCALDRQGRLRAGHLRPRRHQRGHRADRRADGLDPDRRASPARCRRT